MSVFIVNRENPECTLVRQIVRTSAQCWYCSNGESLKKSEWIVKW